MSTPKIPLGAMFGGHMPPGASVAPGQPPLPPGAPMPPGGMPMPVGGPGGMPGGQGQMDPQVLMLLFQLLMRNPQFAAAVTQERAQRQAGGSSPLPPGGSAQGPAAAPQGNPGAGGFAAFVNAKR